ncbi:ABC-three component system protein [Nocardia pseudovaccinii]|uniref:ABC-three component system protein n=1 Tax=Nocardia pseudovaccinii TaxID=189540 RepID=UPI0007C6A0C0|nr:ABC-three component system protein [Nocardia pseudovaccinii]
MSEESSGTDHSAAASVLGYLHQTRWGLLEILRSRTADPGRSLTMEMHDDIAWEKEGIPAELKQLKLHVSTLRNLTDASDDIWRTLRVWMDAGRAGDPYGPVLTLITNSSAGPGSAASYLRAADRDVESALTLLESTARDSKSKETKAARTQFLKLTPSDRSTFVGRIYVADQSADLDGVDEEVAHLLRPGAPTEQFKTYLDLVWAWWARTSIAMLSGKRGAVSVQETLTALEGIRDRFTRDNLPSLVDANDIDLDATAQRHEGRMYVHQLKILNVLPRQLQKAIMDYQRAYLQETRWLDVHLVDYDELDKFSERLVDEWERAFDHMCSELPAGASDDDKRAAGRKLLHLLGDSTLSIRAKFDEPFHARGRRHALADVLDIGWHPEFEQHLSKLLLQDA